MEFSIQLQNASKGLHACCLVTGLIAECRPIASLNDYVLCTSPPRKCFGFALIRKCCAAGVQRLRSHIEWAAGHEVIMSIAGHVSRAMLSRCSHVRMEAKRRALDEIAARQNAADEKRKDEADQREPAAAVSLLAVVQ